MLYLFVFLKIPILFACWIVWWAVKQGTDTDDVSAPATAARRSGRDRTRGAPGTRARPAAAARTPPARGWPRRPASARVTAAGRARELEH